MIVTLLTLLAIIGVALWLTYVLLSTLVEHTFFGRMFDDGLQEDGAWFAWGSAAAALIIDAFAGYLVGLVFHRENIWFPLGGIIVGIVFIILAVAAGNKTDGAEFLQRD
jgi:hypothetical protein